MQIFVGHAKREAIRYVPELHAKGEGMNPDNKQNIKLFLYIALILWMSFLAADYLARMSGKVLDTFLYSLSVTIIFFVFFVFARWK